MEDSVLDLTHDSHIPTILAFDVGGTRIKAGLVRGETISSLTGFPTVHDADPDMVIDSMVEMGRRLMQEAEVTAVGLSVKGIVDPQSGVPLDINESLRSWVGQPIAAIIAQRLGRTVIMDNDARMYAVGELLHGAGRDSANMVCLTLGTGIGCGVALNRRVLRGPRGTGGILGGHVTIDVNGPLCTCGNLGCLEVFIGTGGITRLACTLLQSGNSSNLRPETLDPEGIFRAASAGDPVATEVVRTFVRYLSAGVVTMAHAFDPDTIVLGGGIARASNQFLPAVQRYVEEHTWPYLHGQVRVVPGDLGDAAALIGIAAVARNREVVW